MTNDINAIRSKPIYQLTKAELDALHKHDRLEWQWAVEHIAYLKNTGALAVILANPPGTLYETVWDRGLGWKLRPVASE